MNFELERLSKKVVVTQFEVLSHIYFLENATVNFPRLVGLQFGVWNRDKNEEERRSDLLTEMLHGLCIDCRFSVMLLWDLKESCCVQ